MNVFQVVIVGTIAIWSNRFRACHVSVVEPRNFGAFPSDESIRPCVRCAHILHSAIVYARLLYLFRFTHARFGFSLCFYITVHRDNVMHSIVIRQCCAAVNEYADRFVLFEQTLICVIMDRALCWREECRVCREQ